jgi:hypothetical protein
MWLLSLKSHLMGPKFNPYELEAHKPKGEKAVIICRGSGRERSTVLTLTFGTEKGNNDENVTRSFAFYYLSLNPCDLFLNSRL